MHELRDQYLTASEIAATAWERYQQTRERQDYEDYLDAIDAMAEYDHALAFMLE